MNKIDNFRKILKQYGVTKVYISSEFSFDETEPCGIIRINVNNSNLDVDLYKLFTKAPDGLVAEEQYLGIFYNDFSKIEPNFLIEEV